MRLRTNIFNVKTLTVLTVSRFLEKPLGLGETGATWWSALQSWERRRQAERGLCSSVWLCWVATCQVLCPLWRWATVRRELAAQWAGGAREKALQKNGGNQGIADRGTFRVQYTEVYLGLRSCSSQRPWVSRRLRWSRPHLAGRYLGPQAKASARAETLSSHFARPRQPASASSRSPGPSSSHSPVASLITQLGSGRREGSSWGTCPKRSQLVSASTGLGPGPVGASPCHASLKRGDRQVPHAAGANRSP